MRQAWLVVCALLAAAAGVQTWRLDRLQVAMAEAETRATRVALTYAENTQRTITKARDEKDRAVRDIRDRLDADIAGLRERAERRVPDPADASCAGATGAELSGRDAEFLTRLAARADIIRAELAECQARERAVAERP